MLSKEEVKHIALLARIGLKEEEIEKYQKGLSSVLDFFETLQKADTEHVEAVRQVVGRENSWREDRDRDFIAPQKQVILKNVPETKDSAIKVKSVF
jgi:aspartyl-tRNA(Asn)/glutamyl-tRNA(Gln) amidotransferase subunit C